MVTVTLNLTIPNPPLCDPIKEMSRWAGPVCAAAKLRSDRNGSQFCIPHRAVNQGPSSTLSPVREPFCLSEDKSSLNATMQQSQHKSALMGWGLGGGVVGEAFSMASRVRSRALADYGGCHHLHTRRERVRKRDGAAGCCSTGTGSLSGNPHTCHRSCALLKSVRQRCLCSARTLQEELQQQLEQR